MDVVKKFNTQSSQLKNQLSIVRVCGPVFPRSVMIHVPQMDHIPAECVSFFRSLALSPAYLMMVCMVLAKRMNTSE